MQTRFITFLAVVLVALMPSLVYGHPGHGTFDGLTLFHYATSPLHILSAFAVVTAVVFGVRYFRKKYRQTN